MKGIVNTDLNERQQSPGVNGPISRYYTKGDVVEIAEAVPGDTYDGDDLWYKLKDGGFVWSGAVDIEVDCSTLTAEDRDQYLLCYREVLPDGRPDMASKKVPSSLFFTPVRLPAASESIRVNTFDAGIFSQSLVQSLQALNKQRKHVFIYVHGYQLFSSLKLDLFSQFVQNYMTHPVNNIAKVLFMTWPAQGPGRKTVDDRSIRYGQEFTANNLFDTFAILSRALAAENKCLNLLVHSFGHQLLNGMLNPGKEHIAKIPHQIFENIFLMAPDVTHLTMKQGGQALRNYFKDDAGEDFHYAFSGLTKLGKNVHVFYDQYDYLLYSSTKKFVGHGNLNGVRTPAERFSITKDYRNLGNYGMQQIAPNELESGINFINVEDLIANGLPGNSCDYSFRRIKGTASGKKIEDVWGHAEYNGINAFKIIFNAKRFPDHHRYLFTCKPVVDKVMRLLL